MRILVISDIHANLTALQAVLNDAGEVDATWCLGDLIGYGPDPDECVSIIQSLPNLTCIVGNHDAAVIGRINTLFFNQEARLSIQWARSRLSERNLRFLDNLPDKALMDQVTLVHGSPRNPIWEYLLDLQTAEINFSFFNTQICLTGHTHIPVRFHLDSQSNLECIRNEDLETIPVIDRMILNPGSIGQSRDHDIRASYAIFDPATSTWQTHRVKYDVGSVQARILGANLPYRHAQRLAEGW